MKNQSDSKNLIKKPRVAIISSSDFKAFPGGGITSFLNYITPILSDIFDLSAIGISIKTNKIGNWTKIKIKGKNIHFLPIVRLGNDFVPKMLKVLWGIVRNRKKILTGNFDVLYFHGNPLVIPFFFFKKQPIIAAHFHGLQNPLAYVRIKFFRNILSEKIYEVFCYKLVMKMADKILIASDQQSFLNFSEKYNEYKDKFIRIPNFVDNDFFLKETKKWTIERAKLIHQWKIPEKNFIYIGRFSDEKNLVFLLNTYYKFKKESKKHWGLILIGDGPQKKDIEKLINRKSIKNVFMPGFKQKEELPKYLAVSDVFVLPSVSEGWGLVVNEAMAAGLPILISKKCGCSQELVEDGKNGFSFDPQDTNELLRLMLDIADGKYDLKVMGENSLRIINKFKPELVVPMIAQIIKSILIEKTVSQNL